jgi:hypothetical protein
MGGRGSCVDGLGGREGSVEEMNEQTGRMCGREQVGARALGNAAHLITLIPQVRLSREDRRHRRISRPRRGSLAHSLFLRRRRLPRTRRSTSKHPPTPAREALLAPMPIVVSRKRLLCGTRRRSPVQTTGTPSPTSLPRLPDARIPARERPLSLPPEPRLETVPAPIRQQRRHPRRRKAKLGLLVFGVIAVVVEGIGVDRLTLSFTPGDAPGGVTGGGGEGKDVADEALRGVERPFEGCHAAHGATDDGGDGSDAEGIEDELVDAIEPGPAKVS